MNFEITVVASKNRKALTDTWLKNTSYQNSITPNYELPKNWKPTVTGLVNNHLGAYRCFRGHQDALKLGTKDNVLILEDDAIPLVSNKEELLKILSDSIGLLGHYELVSYHGRQFNRECFESVMGNTKYITPNCPNPWIVAALAYMVNRKSIKRLLTYEYDGTPWDILLYRNFHYCLMEQSIFAHDRQEGSLIDV